LACSVSGLGTGWPVQTDCENLTIQSLTTIAVSLYLRLTASRKAVSAASDFALALACESLKIGTFLKRTRNSGLALSGTVHFAHALASDAAHTPRTQNHQTTSKRQTSVRTNV
jgi:hypothetical protein